MKPRCLDLFCCAGGASTGYARAGFEVIGADIAKQPRYPFPFIRYDALEFEPRFLATFDFIHASPPCQQFCRLRTREDLSGYPDLIEPVRKLLIASGRPWVIENVPEAPIRKDLLLCGGTRATVPAGQSRLLVVAPVSASADWHGWRNKHRIDGALLPTPPPPMAE